MQSLYELELPKVTNPLSHITWGFSTVANAVMPPRAPACTVCTVRFECEHCGGALDFCDAPTLLVRQLGRALCDGPTREGRLGQAAGETAGAGEASSGVRRSVFCSP